MGDPRDDEPAGLDLTLVLACYNEGPVLAPSLAEILQVLEGTRLRYEIVLVDDGSADGTADEIRRLLRVHAGAPLRALFHPRNLGRGATVTDGIRAARGRLVGFLDVDLEVPGRYVPDLVRTLDRGADVAVGFRIYRLTPRILHRWVLSKGYVWLVRRLLRVGLRDTETGCKFFRRERVLPVLEETADPGWFWDTEIMVRALHAGLRIVEVPVLFVKRPEVRSHVRPVHDSVEYLRRLWAFRNRLRAEEAADPTVALRRVYAARADGRRRRAEEARRWALTAPCRQRAFKGLAPLAGRRVLELGAGAGHGGRELADLGGRVIALDRFDPPSPWPGARAVVPVQASAEQLPFRPGSFDLVYAQALLMHVDLERVLEECHRVLRAGGRALFIEPLRHHPLVALYRRLLSPFAVTRPRYVSVAELESAGRRFVAARHEEHHLLGVLVAGRDGQPSWLDRVDAWLLARWPRLRRYCWTTVWELTR